MMHIHFTLTSPKIQALFIYYDEYETILYSLYVLYKNYMSTLSILIYINILLFLKTIVTSGGFCEIIIDFEGWYKTNMG